MIKFGLGSGVKGSVKPAKLEKIHRTNLSDVFVIILCLTAKAIVILALLEFSNEVGKRRYGGRFMPSMVREMETQHSPQNMEYFHNSWGHVDNPKFRTCRAGLQNMSVTRLYPIEKNVQQLIVCWKNTKKVFFY